ncbi:hypothetical protein D3C75_579790 [compost metagenome]
MSVIEADKKREATASIRGYIYQLDATLLEILRSGIDDEVVIEGIEDFDTYSTDNIVYSQVKYYAGQNLTNSVLRDPLHKLFTHFINLSEAQRDNRKYIIYGHYASVNISTDKLTVQRFKETMEYTKETKGENGKKTRTNHSLLDGILTEDSVIHEFCQRFEIKISENFDDHRKLVIEAVRLAHGVSLLEAEGFSYPRAFDYISSLAVKTDHNDRKSNQRQLLENLKGCQAIHHKWMLRENSSRDYERYFKRLYFQQQNIHGTIRFFIIEVDPKENTATINDLLVEISKKWSSANVKNIPDRDRHASFVILRGVDQDRLPQVKHALYDSGIDFVDGYPYRDSPYRESQLLTAQTQTHKISLRLIDTLEHLAEAVRQVERRLCYVYDFFLTQPSQDIWSSSSKRTFSIPIENLSNIKSII